MNDKVQIEIILDKDCQIIFENNTDDLPDPMEETYDIIENTECYPVDTEYSVIELDKEFMEEQKPCIHNDTLNIEKKNISDLNFVVEKNIENKSCLQNILEKKIRNIIDEDSIIDQIDNTIDENVKMRIEKNK